MRNRHGFTLIELAIVLTIVGLIVGSILYGQELVRAAQARLQVSQIEKLDTAVNTFRAKYNCLPGDCPHAVSSGLSSEAQYEYDGDGSGAIEITDAASIDGDELQYFWYHLSQSRLLGGDVVPGNVPGVNSPKLAMPGQGVSGNSSGGFWFIGAFFGLSTYRPVSHYILTTNNGYSGAAGVYLGPDAYRIDSKIDDGLPGSGKITVRNGNFTQLTSGGRSRDSFIDPDDGDQLCDDGTNYNPAYAPPTATSLCAILINLRF